QVGSEGGAAPSGAGESHRPSFLARRKPAVPVVSPSRDGGGGRGGIAESEQAERKPVAPARPAAEERQPPRTVQPQPRAQTRRDVEPRDGGGACRIGSGGLQPRPRLHDV